MKFNDAYRYLQTIRYLRIGQIRNRLWRHVYRPSVDRSDWLSMQPVARPWIQSPGRPANMTGPTSFRFLSRDGEIRSAADWNNPDQSRLWLYHLHYFSDLTAAESSSRNNWHRSLIARWIAENPQGHGAGWEPYPISLRVSHWLKWHLAGNELDDETRRSLTQQVRYLVRCLEFHLLGNHLLENYRALALAGAAFIGEEADQWQTQGMQGLEHELSEQLLPDGGHYELSPMYHAIVLEGLLDLLNALQCFGREVPHWLSRACEQMTRWSLIMAHADGDGPQFNDMSLGYATKPLDLAQYAQRLGLSIAIEHTDVVNLSQSGFVRAQRGPWLLFADVGGLGPDCNPGHGHADSLTYELGLHGARFVVDTGISTYEVCDRRLEERSTAAHNTVQIDGKNSSDVWAAFRVGRRARVRDVHVSSNANAVRICAMHDGYRHLRGNVVHRREWRLTDDRIDVIDTIQSKSRNAIKSFLHLSPEYTACKRTDGSVLITDGASRRIASVQSDSWPEIYIETYQRAPEFGRLEPAPRIVFAETNHSHRSAHSYCYSLAVEQDNFTSV